MSITGDKLADETITTEKIKDGNIIGRNLAPGAVTIDKIQDGTLDGREIVMNSNLLAVDFDPDNGDMITYYGEDGHVEDTGMDESTGDIYMDVDY